MKRDIRKILEDYGTLTDGHKRALFTSDDLQQIGDLVISEQGCLEPVSLIAVSLKVGYVVGIKQVRREIMK